MQGVDKQSDSDRLCLHSLFSNRPTQSHQWGAHMHAQTRKHTLLELHANMHTHRHCRSLSHSCTNAATHSVLQAYLQTHIDTLTDAHKVRREASRGKGFGFERVPPEASVLGKWSYHDKGWKSNNGFITFPHVPLHREKEASSVLIRPLGKTCRRIIPRGEAREWVSERQGGRDEEEASSLSNQWTAQTHIVDTSAADIDHFDGPKTIVCIDLKNVPVFCCCLLTLSLFPSSSPAALSLCHPHLGPTLLSSFLLFLCFCQFYLFLNFSPSCPPAYFLSLLLLSNPDFLPHLLLLILLSLPLSSQPQVSLLPHTLSSYKYFLPLVKSVHLFSDFHVWFALGGGGLFCFGFFHILHELQEDYQPLCGSK